MDGPVIDSATLNRLATRLPRYTSYPTANHFEGSVGAEAYRAWLGALLEDLALSLYLHIPYCESLCWYCACSTKATRRYEPVARYLDRLETEIRTVAALAPGRHRITHLHWGGGSPDILTPEDMRRLGATLAAGFRIGAETEFSVEIDPRLLTREKAEALVGIGVNRVSLGIQDFDPSVQEAIGRLQSYEVSKRAIDWFRGLGVASVNMDLIYGLPRQTARSLTDTIERVVALAPDRIAIFGYAHLPARVPSQRLIDESVLPGAAERLAFSHRLTLLLERAGYAQVGLDHFALAADGLASKPLARNFQGYTTDRADCLIGFGASAIGRLPQGFAQNAVATADYMARIDAEGLATARGRAMTADDQRRAFVIEKLMCDFTFSGDAVTSRFGADALDLLREAEAIRADDPDGLIEPTADGFRLTQRGRPFVRNICARFDAYLDPEAGGGRHSLSV